MPYETVPTKQVDQITRAHLLSPQLGGDTLSYWNNNCKNSKEAGKKARALILRVLL